MRNFLETAGFTKAWEGMGKTDDDLAAFQATLTITPNAGSVIPGTGGLRKIRVAAKGKGKRSGGRVIYVNFDEYSYTVLLTCYAKNVDPDLSQEQKEALSVQVAQLEISVRSFFARASKKKRRRKP